jgi:hypothetical protein
MVAGAWAAGAGPVEGSAFFVRVVDEATGRGVPLITLKTTNQLSYVTDSAGVAAVIEPGLMGQTVFFYVSGHGYTYPKDGFGFQGVRLDVRPAAWATVKVKRLNIAERLYRVTGEGIYHDSMLAGEKTPLANPVLNGQVMGQDSVQTCLYNGKLYWFWGDTARPSYPLGHFAMAGAVSDLPGAGGLDPAVGVDLRYFVDDSGFSRKMAPMDEPGMIWLDGIFAVDDAKGRTRMVAKYARMKSLGEAAERGLMAFDDDKQQFVPVVRGGPEFLLCADSGHPFGVQAGGQRYYYFATPFPLGVRMRVKAAYESAIDPEAYEVFTSVKTSDDKTADGGFRWVSTGTLLKTSGLSRHDLIETIRKEKEADCRLYDVETGKVVTLHGGSVYWNAYRGKWISITLQFGGETSFLGEVWYAEADTPPGPWGYARQVATHDRYSFYNPKQHPYFDQDGGRVIYFEGTYSFTFSGSEERATPRYDYNQVMYRLDLADERLCLPEPVYEMPAADGGARYGVGRTFGEGREPAFYAVAPERKREGLVGVHAAKSGGDGRRLTTAGAEAGTKPVFFGMATTAATGEDMGADLYEYVNKKTQARRYGVEPSTSASLQWPPPGEWVRADAPLCRVWRRPPVAAAPDWQARPWGK